MLCNAFVAQHFMPFIHHIFGITYYKILHEQVITLAAIINVTLLIISTGYLKKN